MEGLYQVDAEARPIRVGEATYWMTPLRLKDFAEMERHVLSTRPDPVDAVIAQLPKLNADQQRELLEWAYEDMRRGRYVSAAELDEWSATREGQIYRFWMSLRHRHPELSLDDAEDLLRNAGTRASVAIDRELAGTHSPDRDDAECDFAHDRHPECDDRTSVRAASCEA